MEIAVQNQAHKSKFGYHACSYETYKKLKTLKTLYFQSLYQNAKVNRFNRKKFENRFKVSVRNEKGQRIGWRFNDSVVEPFRYPFFQQKRYIAPGCHALDDCGILQAFEIARKPYEKNKVVPLNLSEDRIDEMLAEFQQPFTTDRICWRVQ